MGINFGFTAEEDKDLGIVAQKLAKLEKVNSNKRLCVVTRGNYNLHSVGKSSTIIATEDYITEFEI